MPYCGLKLSQDCSVSHVDVNVGVQQMHSSVLETEVWHVHGTGGLFHMSHSEGSAAPAIPAGSHKFW